MKFSETSFLESNNQNQMFHFHNSQNL